MKKTAIIIATFISAALFITACSSSEIETNMSEDVRDFNFTTQDEGTLSNTDLEGKWWVADFIFTNCTTVCLPMTSNMSKMQDQLAEDGVENVEFVSFSVDPEQDTPEVLKSYAEGYDADLSNWTFLTGYDFHTIKELSIKSFKSPLQEPQPGDDQVTHGVRFFLVNPEGEVVKSYLGTDTNELEQLVKDLKTVTDS
ncbi:SCO1 protein like protein [Lentibacillus sp. JNUCC-1]|uniref:SCO family protein n=1 Tax=Lentibacillus sp. JNUCC-1 TaxID=2654513 RepID=UPI0012E8C13F|nr:SCO family protein [Lentibacillus sp. JNUCC-1]MUV39109.1 SCO1 protein like protein [Lentibacillus sp. JNUCC-1]